MKFIKKILCIIESRLSMKILNTDFIDNGRWNVICEHIDKFGEIWLAPYPFYIWSNRIKKSIKKPCSFDHLGSCLICDCWPSECAWLRLMKEDYRWETKEELEEMFKDKISYE